MQGNTETTKKDTALMIDEIIMTAPYTLLKEVSNDFSNPHNRYRIWGDSLQLEAIKSHCHSENTQGDDHLE